MCPTDKLKAEPLAALDTSLCDIKYSLSCACTQVPLDGNASLLTEDYLYNVFLFPVNKAEALAYLDAGGPLPARYAKVIAVRSAHSPPDVMEYKVSQMKRTAFIGQHTTTGSCCSYVHKGWLQRLFTLYVPACIYACKNFAILKQIVLKMGENQH